MVLSLVQEMLANGPVNKRITIIGGAGNLSISVEIIAADEIGILCRTKGMMGGWSPRQLRPWATIAFVELDD